MSKICKNQLVGKLVSLFRDADTDIDEAVKEAKNQLTSESKKVKYEDLDKLFDSQIQTLKDRGCPKQIVELVQNQKGSVLENANEMEIPEGHIPFVPVIPRIYMGVYGLMPMVRNNEKQGYTCLDPNEITDKVETPKKPYFIYDVEDGKKMLGKSPEKAEKLIKEQKRFCLTADEGIAVCVHTNVLSDHYVDCTASRYEDTDKVPNVYLDCDRPGLSWRSFGNSDGRWGSASCRSRS